jgi:hypothetical protein
MNTSFVGGRLGTLAVGLLAMAFAACQAVPDDTYTPRASALPSTPATRPAAAGSAVTAPITIRINAGAEADWKDPQGNTWAADKFFEGGTTVDRPDLQITGTTMPQLYTTERYSMDYYSIPVPNGQYTLKLHFSEDYDGIASPTDRLFTYAVKDGDAKTGKLIKEVKDFSPWKASGAQFKAYVDTVPVDVTQGRITITFTPQNENPQINGIERTRR